jgi:hypothetical protein
MRVTRNALSLSGKEMLRRNPSSTCAGMALDWEGERTKSALSKLACVPSGPSSCAPILAGSVQYTLFPCTSNSTSPTWLLQISSCECVRARGVGGVQWLLI